MPELVRFGTLKKDNGAQTTVLVWKLRIDNSVIFVQVWKIENRFTVPILFRFGSLRIDNGALTDPDSIWKRKPIK